MNREDAIEKLKQLSDWVSYQGNRNAVQMAIRALEEEPCEDCVSKKEVIDILDYWYDSDSDGYVQASKSINALPLVQPTRAIGEWVPVSEKLPEDESAVLATIRWYDRAAKEYRHYCVLCNYRRGIQSHYKDTWTYEQDEFGEVEVEHVGEKIVAWMPIPEPYKPKEGDNK